MSSQTVVNQPIMNPPVVNQASGVLISDPPLARLLFSSTRLSWLWLIIRVYLGWEWLTAGWGKFNNPAWLQTGDALKGFWTAAFAIPETGRAPINYD